MTTESTIRSAVEAYDRGDFETVSSLLSDTVCYTINAHPDHGPYRADCHSKAAFFDAVGPILSDWRMDSYKITDLVTSGSRGAARIAVAATSNHTGRTLQSGLALFFTVEDGLITAIHEYHDTAAVATARAGA